MKWNIKFLNRQTMFLPYSMSYYVRRAFIQFDFRLFHRSKNGLYISSIVSPVIVPNILTLIDKKIHFYDILDDFLRYLFIFGLPLNPNSIRSESDKCDRRSIRLNATYLRLLKSGNRLMLQDLKEKILK